MMSPATQSFRTVGAVVVNEPAFVGATRVQSSALNTVEFFPPPMPRRPVSEGGQYALHDTAYTPVSGTVRPDATLVTPPTRLESDARVTRVHTDVVGVCVDAPADPATFNSVTALLTLC